MSDTNTVSTDPNYYLERAKLFRQRASLPLYNYMADDQPTLVNLTVITPTSSPQLYNRPTGPCNIYSSRN